MSSSEKKDDDFAYESSVHGENLLLRLNSQREQGLLCDVTVVVEDLRFRAHRSVLAASSDFFLSRVVPPSNGELIITLPEEVTVKGFVPLLRFAYTSKLLVNKDNLLEIRKCAKFLEVHDIEETCFEFLQLKFSDHKTESSECPRKKCCKSFCPKASNQRQADETQRVVVHEVEDIWREDFSQNLKCPSEIENLSPSPESPKQPCETFCFARENASNFSSLCPKYRKFQKACRSGRVRSVSTCSSNQEAQSLSPAPSSEPSEGNSQPKSQVEDLPVGKPDVGLSALPPPDTYVIYKNLMCSEDKIAPPAVFPPCFPLVPGLPDFSSVPFPCAYQPYRNVNYIDPPNSSSPAGLPDRGSNEASNSRPPDLPRTDPEMSSAAEPQPIQERSNVEREVAEHLAKGFWTDVYRTEFSGQQEMDLVTPKQLQEVGTVDKRSECPWLAISISNETPERTFTTLNPVSCPFINTISNEDCATSPSRNSESMGSTPEKCPYVCPINLEEESETDSEEDSGGSFSAKELECEQKLPFNAQKIISLSRYDFQSLVKMHNLTSEQLDFIHDIRRRSKNRIAAQRCRKRKLDCIQNLETEIQKLQNEKRHLLKERDQILSTLGETKQNLSGLCHQVCREASLSREQIQVLAKYSSSECPLSFLAPEGGKLLLQCEAVLQELAGGLLNNVEASHPQVKEGCSIQSPGQVPALPRQSSAQGGIADTCQQVTAKCTTDEQM
ncbi:transcription regulator protein BACH1 [Bufo gargarizans]|uniref:transcription regulator protein BACH1 n=1 Tax=Bufo gargarizans TaxID=30331 RepID=UPI001CF4E960|nr:transcription regulator protein BACH1 [Bufo gargarizans]XP_044143669.1 transcription regulator protein BACH1 [Bufo gargarizans]